MGELGENAATNYVEGAVPDHLDGALVRRPLVEANAEEFLLRLPTVGRFLARRGGEIVVERAQGATDSDLRCFLEGPVVAGAALLGGQLCLRGSAVSISGRAVVICGGGASGKSALAATLGQRGHSVLADSVAVVATDGDAPRVEPLAPDPELWPDMAERLGLDPEEGRVVRPALAKRAYRLGPKPEPAPLAATILLQVERTANEIEAEPLEGIEKGEALLALVWHSALVEALGLEPVRFAWMAQVAGALKSARLSRPPRDASPAALAEIVEGMAA